LSIALENLYIQGIQLVAWEVDLYTRITAHTFHCRQTCPNGHWDHKHTQLKEEELRFLHIQ
jgi:hypothetical protein